MNKLNFLKPYLILALQLSVVILVLTGLSRVIGPLPISINTKNIDKDNTFSVTAEGKTYIRPDIAKVSLAISATGNQPTDAQKKANEVINKVTDEVVKLGVDKDYITTTNFNIYPNYYYPPYGQAGSPSITSYTANVTIEVKVKDIDKINKVIDTATSNGVNQVYSLTFDVENKDKAMDEARKIAIQKAKAKASSIAGEAGIRLGRVINISEGYSNGYPYPMMMAEGMKGYGAGGGGDGTSTQPGQTEISVTVTLSYETL